MNKNDDNIKDSHTQSHDESVDEIMQSIMASIAKDNPSPLDEDHQAVIQEARPLEYDLYRYDDKPAVILGAGMSATSGMSDSKRYAEERHDTPDTNVIEPIDEDLDPNQTNELSRDAIDASLVSQEAAVEKTSSFQVPANIDPSQTYHAQFDFGFKNPPKIISVFPFVLHVLISIAVAVFVVYTFSFSRNQALSPFSFNSNVFTLALYGLGIIVAWGLIFGLLAGIISYGISKERSWLSKLLLRSGLTTLIGVLLWIAAMAISEAFARGIIAF